MNIREQNEQLEVQILSPYASLSVNCQGRDREEAPSDMRTEYQRDRDRIIHSKAFRRLKHKTQVFLAPMGDHYRTRLTHTLEVSQIARTIAKSLRLNEDLTEAIALGHDLGHTPFGHAGERALNSVCEYGFKHYEQSIRVVELLEKDGKGLNLTKEVRDGMVNHRTSGKPSTLEGKIVRLSDKIAYINHDIDDAIRGKIISEEDIPKEFTDILGNSTRDRLDFLIHDVVNNSINQNDIYMSPEGEQAMMGLRTYMFENVYRNPLAKSEEVKVEEMLIQLYTYYLEHTDQLPAEFQYLMKERGEKEAKVVCDYIAGMSDQYSVAQFEKIFVPKFWKL
ncbi:MAG: deoxyguanosinetriphosphate triphosphohydrolase [Eubacterium sp.]|nr:deoxyguanosinetriphosphate triphosphohydrolase [Eubacterium sp.]